MIYPLHDPAITTIRARPDRRAYGMGLGIILLDDVYPGFPGDVRNASGYPFPIQYEVAEGVDIHNLVVEEDKSPCLEPILPRCAAVAAPRLSRHCGGVRLLRLLPAGSGRGDEDTGLYV